MIDDLIAGIEAGEPWLAIRGNHDQMFLDFLDVSDDDAWQEGAAYWLRPNLGGPTTLASYGIADAETRTPQSVRSEAEDKIPASHRDFLLSLPLYRETEDLICVHAGIMPGVPMPEQDAQDLIWIRDPFLYDTTDHGKLVVHGHTPVDQPHHAGNHVNLDTGAGFGRPLTVAVFEGRDCWVLTDEGRVPLRP